MEAKLRHLQMQTLQLSSSDGLAISDLIFALWRCGSIDRHVLYSLVSGWQQRSANERFRLPHPERLWVLTSDLSPSRRPWLVQYLVDTAPLRSSPVVVRSYTMD